MTYINNFQKTFLVLMIVLSIFSCSDNVSKQLNLLDYKTNSELCFKRSIFQDQLKNTLETTPPQYEYIHIVFQSNASISGKIYTTEEVAGDVYYPFTGEVKNDSTLVISVKFGSTSERDEKLIVRYSDTLQLLRFYNDEIFIYNTINSSEMPDTSKYESIFSIENDFHGEFDENNLATKETSTANKGYGLIEYDSIAHANQAQQANTPLAFTVYYEQAPTYSNKRITSHEFLRLTINGDFISGKRLVIEEGEPDVTYSCAGTMLNDTTFELTYSVNAGNNKTKAITEKWTMKENWERIAPLTNKISNATTIEFVRHEKEEIKTRQIQTIE